MTSEYIVNFPYRLTKYQNIDLLRARVDRTPCKNCQCLVLDLKHHKCIDEFEKYTRKKAETKLQELVKIEMKRKY